MYFVKFDFMILFKFKVQLWTDFKKLEKALESFAHAHIINMIEQFGFNQNFMYKNLSDCMYHGQF